MTTKIKRDLNDLNFWNTDQSVDPPVMTRGMMGRDSSGTWRYLTASASGYLMVSGTFGSGSFTAAPTSADSSSISAKQGDAALLRTSALWAQRLDATNDTVSAVNADAGTFLVSAKSGDAALFRVSSIGGSFTAAPLSADGSSVSAKQQDAANLMVSTKSGDAALMRVSAIGVSVNTSPLSADSSSISSKQGDATNLNVSAKSLDAGTFLVSAAQKGTWTLDTGSVSAKSSDAGTFRVSAINSISALSPDAALFRISAIGTVTVSAHEVKQSDAASLLISAKQGDAALLRISAIGTLTVSAHEVKQSDAASMLVSAKQGDAALLRVSAITFDAANQRVSASIFPDTTGGLTMFSNFNVSTSQAIKAAAGAVYGWYAWNNDSKPNWVNLYNTSGAINVGTDAIKVQIYLPASAAANAIFPIGLAGFTAGIGVASVSAAVSTATTAGAASAIGLNLFYK